MKEKYEELLGLIVKEADDSPKEIQEKEHILMAMSKFISNLDDDLLDDTSYDKIEIAFDALFDVIVSLEEEDLDDKSDEEFVELMDAFEKLETVSVAEAYKYKPKKVSHGKRRSQKARLTGSAKRDYIKKLKTNRKKYKKSASLRLKAKKTGKKYRRSAKGKQSKRIYKSLNR